MAHHVTQRGNNRQDVFFVHDDRRVDLEILRQQATRWGVRLPGYCLMASGRLRTSTHRGRPLASDAFPARLERALGRRLRPLPAGRPPKAAREGPK